MEKKTRDSLFSYRRMVIPTKWRELLQSIKLISKQAAIKEDPNPLQEANVKRVARFSEILRILFHVYI